MRNNNYMLRLRPSRDWPARHGPLLENCRFQINQPVHLISFSNSQAVPRLAIFFIVIVVVCSDNSLHMSGVCTHLREWQSTFNSKDMRTIPASPSSNAVVTFFC